MMKSGNKSFGKRLRVLRDIKGYTQEELSELVDLEYQTISRIETGTYFTSYDTLEKLAKALDVPIKELFNYEETSTRDEVVGRIKNLLDNCSEKELSFIYSTLLNLEKINS